MSTKIAQLLKEFERRLFASASDEYNERASHKGIKDRYDALQVARANLIRAIEELQTDE
jgi:hypothetical protein